MWGDERLAHRENIFWNIFHIGAQKKGYAPKRVTLFCTAESVVGRAGFEPATNGLKVRCSTS
jgi:hypothetical protein